MNEFNLLILLCQKFILDFTCQDGQASSTTMLVGMGEAYTLTFNTTKVSSCAVNYQSLTGEGELNCKTGLRFSCSMFRLPNKDANKCSNGAKLATSARNRP